METPGAVVGSSLSSGILFHNRFFSGSTSDALALTDSFHFLPQGRLTPTYITEERRQRRPASLNTVEKAACEKLNEKRTCVRNDDNGLCTSLSSKSEKW